MKPEECPNWNCDGNGCEGCPNADETCLCLKDTFVPLERELRQLEIEYTNVCEQLDILNERACELEQAMIYTKQKIKVELMKKSGEEHENKN